jgi:hypothetical protein
MKQGEILLPFYADEISKNLPDMIDTLFFGDLTISQKEKEDFAKRMSERLNDTLKGKGAR